MHIFDKNPNFDLNPNLKKKLSGLSLQWVEILKCLILQLIVDYFEKDFEESILGCLLPACQLNPPIEDLIG